MIVVHVLGRLAQGTVRGMVHRWPTTLLALGLLVGGPLALWSRGMIPGMPPLPAVPGLESAGSGAVSDVREMTIESLRPARGGEQINLILKEKTGNRRLVIVVGQAEALAIASDLNKGRPERPITSYDLMRSIVQEFGGTVNRVVVNNVTETTFYAKVVVSASNRQIEVDSSPSDAIALALRSKAPIFAEANVLDKAGVLNP